MDCQSAVAEELKLLRNIQKLLEAICRSIGTNISTLNLEP